ncbi:MAG: hypothetical protein H8D45_04515 [Bacteroidetes bacterium]|nr:hypothetical protein [Bacteroidota bacterium]
MFTKQFISFKKRIIAVLLLFLFATSLTFADVLFWNVWGEVRDVNTQEGVSGVTILYTVAYSTNPNNLPANPEELPQRSATGISAVNGDYSITINRNANETMIWQKIEIYNYPQNVIIDFPGSNNGPRYCYNLQYVPNPPHPNWTSTYWFVIDTESGGGGIIVDNDFDGIDDNEEYQLALNYAPVLHKHAWDKQEDLANADIWIDYYGEMWIYGIAGSVFSTNPLHRWNSPFWCTFGWPIVPPEFSHEYRIDFDDNQMYQGATPGSRPLYYHVYANGDATYVQYWYFLAYNDLRYYNQTANNTYHEGDWEHVEIKLIDGVPDQVNFYQHYGGYT